MTRRGRPPEGPAQPRGQELEWTGPSRGRLVGPAGEEAFRAVSAGGAVWVRFRGRTWRLEPGRGAGTTRGAGDGSGISPRAPMPGIVLLVAVKEGDRVARGDLLLTLEAMKIEHEVRAAAAGTVRTVRVEGGQRVEAGEELVEIVPEAEAEADRGGGGERR